MSEKLKPCDWCGTAPSDDPDALQVQAYHWPNSPPELQWEVICEACLTESGEFATREEAIAAWNRRTITPEQRND